MSAAVLAGTLCLGILQTVSAQAPEGAVKPSVLAGEVTSVADKGLVITTKSGPVNVEFTVKTEFKRVPPDNPTLKAAVPAAASDIGTGDKVMVTGIPAADGRSIPARSVYLMTKSDIVQKQAKDVEKWRTRGISGKVTAVDPTKNEITVQIAGLVRNSSLILSPKESAKFLRYAPDSIRFDEAKPSSLAEIRTGDMLRALGDRSEDGTTFAAEEVVSGAFQTIAGTVKTVDSEKGEVVIKDLQSKKDVTVVVTTASVLKRFPPEMAERMAGSPMGPGGVRPAGGGVQPAGGGNPQSQEGGGVRPGGGGGFGGRGGARGNVDDMLERFPNITPADLKPGDMIAISSSKGADLDRVKAIKLLAGVEPFLRMAQAAGGAQRSQGIPGGISIPGLDGIGFP